MKARDFRALARQALSGRWGVAVLTGFLAALLGGTMASSGSSGSGGSSVGSSAGEFIQSNGGHYEIPDFVWTALIIFGTLLSIYALVCFIIGGTVQLGYAKFNLALIDHKDAQVSDLFSQFHRFGDGFLLNLLTSIFIFLWSLLLVIPGIVAAFSYSMAPYILYENPGMRPNDARKASKELMRGNKWRLFCLELSFFGWALLSALTLGIGTFWLRPYEEPASTARSAGNAPTALPLPTPEAASRIITRIATATIRVLSSDSCFFRPPQKLRRLTHVCACLHCSHLCVIL